MNSAVNDLINEHKAIQIAQNNLEKIQEMFMKNYEADIKDIIDLLDFLKVFSDKCHHGKEDLPDHSL